jgi:DNA recombination protein RmuC
MDSTILLLFLALLIGASFGYFLGRKSPNTALGDLNVKLAVLEEQKRQLEAQKSEQDQNQKMMKEDFNEVVKRLQEQMKSEFHVMANNIFEEKTDKFKKTSQENITQILSPFKEQIDQFKKDVGEKYSNESKERFSLQNKIDELMNLNKVMSEEAKNLTTALKGDVKKQGSWGEFKLERLLEISGLNKNTEYVVQGKGMGLKNEEGNNEQPDFVILLPDNKHIVVDSKVSLVSYVQFVEATTDDQRDLARAALMKSIRDHIDGLSSKHYYLNEKLTAPEFTFMFSPFEGALSLIIDMNVPNQGISLMQYAWERKIAIVTPMTMMASLKTISSLWRFARQESNALKIADSAGKIYDKFCGFVSDMEDAGKAITKASETHQEAFKKLSLGKDNMFTQFERLKVLGAKTKKSLDSSYVDGILDGEANNVLTEEE